jgi:hypothetical protein
MVKQSRKSTCGIHLGWREAEPLKNRQCEERMIFVP